MFFFFCRIIYVIDKVVTTYRDNKKKLYKLKIRRDQILRYQSHKILVKSIITFCEFTILIEIVVSLIDFVETLSIHII